MIKVINIIVREKSNEEAMDANAEDKYRNWKRIWDNERNMNSLLDNEGEIWG
jgi:hypothetical protein